MYITIQSTWSCIKNHRIASPTKSNMTYPPQDGSAIVFRIVIPRRGAHQQVFAPEYAQDEYNTSPYMTLLPLYSVHIIHNYSCPSFLLPSKQMNWTVSANRGAIWNFVRPRLLSSLSAWGVCWLKLHRVKSTPRATSTKMVTSEALCTWMHCAVIVWSDTQAPYVLSTMSPGHKHLVLKCQSKLE